MTPALPRVPKTCPLKSYVDDSKLYLSFSIKNTEFAATQINEDLKRIATWCCSNSLLINSDKTKLFRLLLLGTPRMLKRVPENFSVTLLEKKIFASSYAKVLGVTIDANLTEVVSKCTASLCRINRVRHVLDKHC